MARSQPGPLTEAKRKEIFLALLQAARQDDVNGREAVARRFGVSEEQLTSIERDGVLRCWPPLD
jgi:hypothetical protein